MKILSFFCCLIVGFWGSLSLNAQTVNCNGYNPWVSTQTYNTETVVYNGVLYQANWNNLNAIPSSNAGSAQPWTVAGTCALPISYKTVSCTSQPTWSGSSPYTGGTEVVFNNYLYQANNWTEGVQPDVNGDNSWHLEGQCQAATTLTVTGTLTAFTAFAGSISTGQSITVSGISLSGNVTLTAPTNFQISLSASSGYTSSIVLTPSSGNLSTTTIYVFYNPTAVGSHSGNLTISGGGITTQNIALSGTAQATGIWLANGTNIYNSNTGNVGIGTGTSALQGKLHVNGTSYLNGNVMVLGETRFSEKIATTEVFVTAAPLTATFPDYVFAPNYKLLGLDSLELYIKQNQHLPEVPSAQCIQEEGKINLGEMNNLLLKKVEELTLYMIEQRKNTKQQQELINQLIEQNQLLKVKVDAWGSTIK